MHPDRGAAADPIGDSVPGLVAASLLLHDLPGASWDERDRAARYVQDSVTAMPDFTRFGVRVAGAAAYGVLCVLSGGRFRTRPDARRARAAARLVAVPLPVLGEFGRLTRGLGLVSVHEQRHTDTATGTGTGTGTGAGPVADPVAADPAP